MSTRQPQKLILEPGVRLDLFLAENLGQDISRTRIQKLIETGAITASLPLKASFKAKKPTEITVILPEEKPYDIEPVNLGVPIIFQDKHLAIIHKPSGMTVHPGANTGNDTLVHTLLAQIKSLADTQNPDRPGIVHRIDRETEGLLVVAKSKSAHTLLAESFKLRKIEKIYYAVVWGKMPEKGNLTGYIGRDPKNRKKMKYAQNPLNGSYKESITEYETVKANEGFSLIKLKLITGRTHQIRASLAAINHAVVGDLLYSSTEKECKKYKIRTGDKKHIQNSGMLLISAHLQFTHPLSRKKLTFSLPLPERFQNLFN